MIAIVKNEKPIERPAPSADQAICHDRAFERLFAFLADELVNDARLRRRRSGPRMMTFVMIKVWIMTICSSIVMMVLVQITGSCRMPRVTALYHFL